MKKVLILGGEGMLGHKVFQVLTHRFEAYATFRNPQGLWFHFPMYATAERNHLLPVVDALDFNTVVRAVELARPEVIINCIGIVKQLEEANDPIISLTVNSLLPHKLAALCKKNDIRLVHISTDCVFNGKKGNYTEADMPDAEDLYGRTKFLGEVTEPGCLTIRTSFIGRDFLKQSSLLEWFLSNRGKKVKGYKNSIYTGLTTETLAHIISDILDNYPELSGLYHVASQPISKYELLVKIRDVMSIDIGVEPYDNPRSDLSLDSARFIGVTGYAISNWDEMIAKLVVDPTPYDEWRSKYAHV